MHTASNDTTPATALAHVLKGGVFDYVVSIMMYVDEAGFFLARILRGNWSRRFPVSFSPMRFLRTKGSPMNGDAQTHILGARDPSEKYRLCTKRLKSEM